MLGNGARFLGPSGAGNAAGSTNNNQQQHQTQFGRGVWPTATTFHANGGECEYQWIEGGEKKGMTCFLLNIIARPRDASSKKAERKERKQRKYLFISAA